MSSDSNFKWTADLVKEFCEYAGLRIGKSTDIREQLNYLIEDFKSSQSSHIGKEKEEKRWWLRVDNNIEEEPAGTIGYWHEKDLESRCLTGAYEWFVSQEIAEKRWEEIKPKEAPQEESVFDSVKLNERLLQLQEIEEAFNAGKFFKDYNAFCGWKLSEFKKNLNS